MKSCAAICVSLLIVFNLHAQYYLRGEVRDERNNPLANVKILLHSTGYQYISGNEGGFGIPIRTLTDSLTLSAEGFEVYTIVVKASDYQNIRLKSLTLPIASSRKRLLSFTKNFKPEDWHGWTIASETYSSLVENDFVQADRFPETGFALTIDKASYSNVRRFLNMNSTVPPDAVRIEELLNYFNFGYTPPVADSMFGFHSWYTTCPWKEENKLLFLQVCAKKIDLKKIPPANLVFLVDISGSMDMPNRLPLLKAAFRLMVNNLRAEDTVSIVVYGSSVGVWLPPTSGNNKNKILKAIEDLYPGGATPGEAGIRVAYRLAKSQFIQGGNNRVILATDGDFNVGQTTEDELDKLITEHKQWGIYLTCLGVGMGNYKDSKLEVLAKKGNGNFAYLDDEKEAEKVLVKEFTQTIYAVANNAYLDIDIDPALVKSYRLIGFDNKLKALDESMNEVEGGEVGSGHSLLAMFEIVPASGNETLGNAHPDIGKILLHYKLPGEDLGRVTSFNASANEIEFDDLPAFCRFGSSLAMFGGMLKKSRFMKNISWTDLLEIAQQSRDTSDPVQTEFISLISKARKIYGKEKKHKSVSRE